MKETAQPRFETAARNIDRPTTAANQERLHVNRWLTVRIALVLLLCLPAVARSQFTTGTNATGLTITGYTGTDAVVVIPSVINNLPVTSIGAYAFEFGQDSRLASVTIPDSVTSIGDGAFSQCTSLTTATIPDSVTTIGAYAFYGCTSLTTGTIPDSVTSIGANAFGGCAFTNVAIGNGVTTIGSDAFEYCTSLASITVGPQNPNFIAVNGVLYDINQTTLIQYPPAAPATDYTIPGSVTSIPTDAFNGADNLTSITIPGSVTSIPSGAFSDCTSLSNVTISEGVASISSGAIGGCPITNIFVPESVTSIGSDPFGSVASISVSADNQNYTSVNGVLFTSDLTELIEYPAGAPNASYAIPNTVKILGTSAFTGCNNLTSVTIPQSLTTIPTAAFSGCRGLISLNLPDSITGIGEGAFVSCTGLTSVTIPNSVNSIGSYAFVFCGKLKVVMFGANVGNIGNDAFEDCSSLSEAIFMGDAPTMGEGVFFGAASNFKVYYLDGAAGFTSPVWTAYISDIVAGKKDQYPAEVFRPGFPLLTTSSSAVITGTSAILYGDVNPMGNETTVSFEYGTTTSYGSTTGTEQVIGVVDASFNQLASGLTPDTLYHYCAVATGSNGTVYGGDETFTTLNAPASGSPGGYTLPQAAPDATGSITVNLSPDAIGQWRIFGELDWRDSGDTATGLTIGNYEVEFEPENDYQQPGLQVVPLAAGQQAIVSGTYTVNGSPTVGSLQVNLPPQGTGGWRFQGESAWRSGGATVSNLNSGDYILEFEPVTGLATPPNAEAVVYANDLATVNITYLIADSTVGEPPVLVSDTEALTQAPYVFTGQIQTDEGVGSGFVPLDRVVVTAAHVLFDDSTLSYVKGVRWFFQYESGEFEAPAQIPAGSYVLSGYATQRASDISNGGSPGVATTASRQLDAAALYFLEPAARGGQSGYLSNNFADNPWLTGTTGKFIAGYPVTGVSPTGYLYATPTVSNPFQYVTGSLFSTTAITSYSGNSGGPLFVRYSDGNFYPAAIYLGGSAETIVHAIDDDVVALMNEAETSGNGGANNSGGGIIQVNEGISGLTASALGSVKVTMSPAGAVSDGAYWEIGDGVKRYSGEPALGLAPGIYPVEFFAAGSGYSAPSPSTANISVTAGNEADVKASYTPNPPAITSAGEATAIEGQPFSYQIKVDPNASGYSTTSTLPPGLTLDGTSGLVSGTVPLGTGTGVGLASLQATNAEGTGNVFTLALTIAMPGKLDVAVSGLGSVPKAFDEPSILAVGSTTSIKATPGKGYLFYDWTDADTGAVLSTQAAYTFPRPAGLNLQANFVVDPFLTAKGAYRPLLIGNTYSESGYAAVTLAPTGIFTASFDLGGTSVKLRGEFNAIGQYSGQVNVPGGASYDASLSVTSTGLLSGTLTNTSDSSQIPLSAERIAPHLNNSLAGVYTAQMPVVSNSSSQPGGNGYGAITVTKTGGVKLIGKLGDGVPLSMTGSLDSNGDWPFLFTKPATHSTGAELVVGTVAFPPATSAPSGTLDWYRSANPNDSVYSNGFSLQITFLMDRYTPPPTTSGSATVSFSGADISGTTVESISISASSKVTYSGTDHLALSFIPATGLFSGSIEDNNIVRPFTGAVIESGSFGMGLFEEKSGETGSVLIEPTR